ncbi:MAG TPA: hypothetical protein VHS97_10010, partial [Isosphaeraceae bacterium]|nr:hypothetical protein [Isosphaeraceae bacterium]
MDKKGAGGWGRTGYCQRAPGALARIRGRRPMGVDPSHPLRDASDGERVIPLAATPNELLKPD